MDTVYYTSGAAMTIILTVIFAGMIAALIKPHLLNNRKLVKKPFSRPKILLVGILALFITMFGFSPVLAATEPASVKEARVAQEAARQKAKEDAAKAEQDRLEAQKPVVKIEEKKEAIPFETREVETGSLPEGTTEVTTDGVDGERTIQYSVTYIDDKETERTVKDNTVSKQPVNKVISRGTYVAPVVRETPRPAAESSCNPNYSGCVPNVSYDLNCKDVGFRVQVLGRDPYNLDGDNDGWGCESY